ncbi:GntR family transcriptional regulator [Bosea caraganae]|uniref:GntR family transcriptional regulator n=1 Tax=Bosea caraganae TaxID=2763117 RepID=A0A370L3H0_9HYPH|nr:GntR family transcriptional regulator [Bosea caraganae]RDJ22933.1 GntR family transcriptional regulator [Bosea caraganae]RDJ28713.1 GntR family transcriptional regulator [Bosea caraganae]
MPRSAAKPISPKAPKPPLAAPRTRTEALRLQLADEIVSGVLEPGTPLDEQELAGRFGVSRTPVREAIRQLSASGLVSVRPHRGAVVALPTPRQLNDMFEAMAELEGLCAGMAARNMTIAERRSLEALHEELRTLVREGDPVRYHEKNEAFHTAIYAGSHNSYLADITLMTRTRVAPFRRAQFRAAGRLGGSYEEHDLVVQAIMRGDQAGATEAMRKHIGIVRDAFHSYAETR